MAEIIPAIIAKDFKELQAKIKTVEPYVKWVQIDLMDGVFVKSKTYNAPDTLRLLGTDINIEIHLMVEKPEKIIDDWISSGVKRILIHYESTKNIKGLLDKIKDFGLESGIVLKIETPVMVINDLLDKADVVQLMGVAEIGYYGHQFDERVLEKIKILRKKHPDVIIEIDGGIDPENAKKAVKAGANRLVAGSYIFCQFSESSGEGGDSKNIKEAIENLRNI